MNMICAICGKPTDEVGVLLDDVCRLCNPDSHEWADQELEQELWELEQELWSE